MCACVCGLSSHEFIVVHLTTYLFRSRPGSLVQCVFFMLLVDRATGYGGEKLNEVGRDRAREEVEVFSRSPRVNTCACIIVVRSNSTSFEFGSKRPPSLSVHLQLSFCNLIAPKRHMEGLGMKARRT